MFMLIAVPLYEGSLIEANEILQPEQIILAIKSLALYPPGRLLTGVLELLLWKTYCEVTLVFQGKWLAECSWSWGAEHAQDVDAGGVV
eukprot:622839-Pelagomonas_calceolata.AAC.1